MNTNAKTMLAALCAVMTVAVPASAHADRVYFLVGTRHVYKIGADPTLGVGLREQIEQDYADRVAGDQKTYSDHTEAGADEAAESDALNQDLDAAANDRDERLTHLYQPDDAIRERHPELQIDGDGPYQVIGVDFHGRGPGLVFDSFTVLAPWPGYVAVAPPYGWVYGRVYTPLMFRSAYLGWHSRVYVAGGRPAFVGFMGHRGPVNVAIGFNGGRRVFVGPHPIGHPGPRPNPYHPQPAPHPYNPGPRPPVIRPPAATRPVVGPRPIGPARPISPVRPIGPARPTAPTRPISAPARPILPPRKSGRA